MNPMFLSFLKSMQTKSQDAQNPGLWVNGNRMPVQEGTFNMLPPKGPERDKVEAAEQAAKAGKSKNEQDDDMIIPDTIKARNVGRGKGHVVYDGNVDDHSNSPSEHLKGVVGGHDYSQTISPKSVRPVASPQPNATSMQENTNRSMFLTHLQGMQTKSQGAQNPGLWVNGNRMPMHEQQAPTDAPYTKIIDTPEAKARREEDLRQKRELTNKTMKDLDDKEQNYRRAHPSYLRPVASPQPNATSMQENTNSFSPFTSIGRGAGIIGNALLHPLDTAIKSVNSITDDLGNAMVDTSNIQKQTQDEEAARLAATAKANPDLAGKIRQNKLDRNRNIRIYRDDGTKRQQSDPGSVLAGHSS